MSKAKISKAVPTQADLLKSLKSVVKVKDTTPNKKQIRVIDFTSSPDGEIVATLCELSFLIDQFIPIVEQNKNAVQDIFFEQWTEEMWASKNLPTNFKARIKKLVDNKSTNFDDMGCNFIMKFRSDCLAKKLPKASDLKEDETVNEVLVETLLSSVVGLSPDNAHKFAQEEFEVQEATGLPDGGLEKMLDAKEGTDMNIIGKFIVSCINATNKKEQSAIPLLTEAQRNISVEISQKYSVKSGVEERILNYVESLEQLRNLLKFLSVTRQVSNFEFGISDEAIERNRRLTEIAGRFISLTE